MVHESEYESPARTSVTETLGIDTQEPSDVTGALQVENIGGISETTVEFTPGVTILAGENATNRTSLLSALAGVLGGTAATLKTDADEGRVSLQLSTGGGAEATYERTYHRSHGTVRTEGEPLVEDSQVVDTFVTLFEHNDARQTVARGGDLRDVLMRPVDTADIERELNELLRQRTNLEDELEELDRTLDRESHLLERRETLSAELEEIEAELDAKRETIAEYEADLDVAKQAADIVEELEATRDRARTLENERELLRAELDALEEERSDLRTQLQRLDEELDAVESLQALDVVDSLKALDAEQWNHEEAIRQLEKRETALQAQKNEVTETIESLTRIVEFNTSFVEEANQLPGISEGGDVTEELAPSTQELECWTCGNTVERQAVRDRTAQLETFLEEKREQRDEASAELERIRETLKQLRETRREREEMRDRLAALEDEREEVREELAALEDEIETVRTDISNLQERAAETETLRESDLLDAYEELNELEYDRGRLENQLDDVESQLADVETARHERDQLQERLSEVRDEIAALRTRVADLERSAVEAFNTHMADLLSELGYENLERVWIERKVPESSTTGEGTFELHIVRESDGVYEDRVENLSESEREVIGLIVALAGYLVHDVTEQVPFLVLDSVEAVDANRLVSLVEYFAEYTLFLTVALLPEDAAAFPDSYPRLTPDELTR